MNVAGVTLGAKSGTVCQGKINVTGVTLGTKIETVHQGKMTVAGIQPLQGHQINQK